MRIVSDPVFIPWLCKQIGLDPVLNAQCILCMDNENTPIAGVVYENYNTLSICAHIWIAEGRTPSKQWYAAIFDYPFNHLGVRKVIGRVVSGNVEALRLDEHFGFALEAKISDYSPYGDLLIYTMTREQCRVLNSPLWARTVAVVSSVGGKHVQG